MSGRECPSSGPGGAGGRALAFRGAGELPPAAGGPAGSEGRGCPAPPCPGSGCCRQALAYPPPLSSR